MTTIVRPQPLWASTGMLVTENERLRRRRDELETEIAELEQRMATTNTDDLIRTLKADIDLREQKLAEAREVLAKAESHQHTLARDRAAAQEAAQQAATAACEARLSALLDKDLELVEHEEQLERQLLDVRKMRLKNNAEARREAGLLGRADVVPTALDTTKRMSLRSAKIQAQLPGCAFRFGYIVLPSGSFGLVPESLTWSEDERRFQRDARGLIGQKD